MGLRAQILSYENQHKVIQNFLIAHPQLLVRAISE